MFREGLPCLVSHLWKSTDRYTPRSVFLFISKATFNPNKLMRLTIMTRYTKAEMHLLKFISDSKISLQHIKKCRFQQEFTDYFKISKIICMYLYVCVCACVCSQHNQHVCQYKLPGDSLDNVPITSKAS